MATVESVRNALQRQIERDLPSKIKSAEVIIEYFENELEELKKDTTRSQEEKREDTETYENEIECFKDSILQYCEMMQDYERLLHPKNKH